MRRLVAVFVTCFFVFSGLVVASPALALEGEAADVFAARVIAKSSGARVLVSNLLDEFSTTYVNPDDTLTTDSYGAAIRVRDDRTSSGWRDLDYDLAFKADGSVSPKSGLFSLFISGGGTASQVASSGVVRVTSPEGSLVGFGWAGSLPKPVLVGRLRSALLKPKFKHVKETYSWKFRRHVAVQALETGSSKVLHTGITNQWNTQTAR